MIYSILKFLIRCTAELFYSKHKIIHFENLDTSKPLIICANHAAAHLDGMLIMIFSKRRFHVLVRADVFNKPWIAKFLSYVNLIPIYRMRDGYKNLDKNSDTFDKSIDILHKNGAVIIFPEANCVMERKLRPLHKGAAKLAFMAEERAGFTLGLQVCAIGISQERLCDSGGRLFLEANKTRDLADYFDAYKEHPNKAYLQLMADVETDLRAVLPVIERRNDEELFENLIVHLNLRDDYDKWKSLAKSINDNDDELKDVLLIAIKDFQSHLKKRFLDIRSVLKFSKYHRLKRWSNILLYLIDVLALFPFFLLGFVFNVAPYALPKWISHSIFRKDKEYANGTHIALAALLFALSYLFFGISLYIVMGNIISVMVSLLIIAICGVVAYHYIRRIKDFIKALSYEFSSTATKKEWKAQSDVLLSEFKHWI